MLTGKVHGKKGQGKNCVFNQLSNKWGIEIVLSWSSHEIKLKNHNSSLRLFNLMSSVSSLENERVRLNNPKDELWSSNEETEEHVE